MNVIDRKKLAIPTVHLNGTSKSGLLEPLLEAATALHRAQRRLANTGPNPRDYYVQGDRAFEIAREQHAERLRRLADITNEIADIAEGILDQGGRS